MAVEGKQKRRIYTSDEIADALALLDANEGRLSETARTLGMSPKTLWAWKYGRRKCIGDTPAVDGTVGAVASISPAAGQALPLVAGKKLSLADAFDKIAWRSVRILTAAKLREAGPSAVATVAAICVDKSRLLRGEPGQITADASAPAPDLSRLSPAERDQLEELLARAEGKEPVAAVHMDALPPDALPWERQAHGSTHDSPESREIPASVGDS